MNVSLFDVYLELDKNRSYYLSRMELQNGLRNYNYDKSVDIWMLLVSGSNT
jgi:hypothetical protein